MADSDKDQFQAAAVENEAAGKGGLSQTELDAMVASSDTGARSPGQPAVAIMMLTALAWSLFQLWIASPLPFIIGFGVFNDTEARAIHLAFALFLAFTAYPAAHTRVNLVLGIAVPVILDAPVHHRRQVGHAHLVDPAGRRGGGRRRSAGLAEGPHPAPGNGAWR